MKLNIELSSAEVLDIILTSLGYEDIPRDSIKAEWPLESGVIFGISIDTDKELPKEPSRSPKPLQVYTDLYHNDSYGLQEPKLPETSITIDDDLPF